MIANSHNSGYNGEEKQQQVTLVFQIGYLRFFFPKNYPPRTPNNQTNTIRQNRDVDKTSNLTIMKEDRYHINSFLIKKVSGKRSPDAFCWTKASLSLVEGRQGWRTLWPFEILDSEVFYYQG